jgi:hypothetical protein
MKTSAFLSGDLPGYFACFSPVQVGLMPEKRRENSQVFLFYLITSAIATNKNRAAAMARRQEGFRNAVSGVCSLISSRLFQRGKSKYFTQSEHEKQQKTGAIFD